MYYTTWTNIWRLTTAILSIITKKHFWSSTVFYRKHLPLVKHGWIAWTHFHHWVLRLSLHHFKWITFCERICSYEYGWGIFKRPHALMHLRSFLLLLLKNDTWERCLKASFVKAGHWITNSWKSVGVDPFHWEKWKVGAWTPTSPTGAMPLHLTWTLSLFNIQSPANCKAHINITWIIIITDVIWDCI